MTLAGDDIALLAKHYEDAARVSIDWVEHAHRRLKPAEARLLPELRSLRLRALELKRLREAAARPMAVAVFGASQHGKSYAVSVLAGGEDGLRIKLNGEAQSVGYIGRINPAGGKESSAFVTRFTLRSSSAPPDYPVALRLLSHADIIKILLNAYLFEGDPAEFERDKATGIVGPSPERIEAHLQRFEGGSGAGSGLTTEDIWDIAHYVETDLRRLGFVERLEPFWASAAKVVPGMSLAGLGEFWSLLWGGHDAITSTYLRLVRNLADLGFASEAHCGFGAIDIAQQTKGEKSILDVEALFGLASDDAGTVEVKTQAGRSAHVPRPILCALTAELHLQIDKRPWDFFDTTDLLDFPGYRTRGFEVKSLDGVKHGGFAYHFENNPAKTLKEFVLRGKVEFLFQRYVAEREVTAMLFCVKDGPIEVQSLPMVLGDWVARSHGETADARAGQDALLFFVLTMFDNHLSQTAADSAQWLSARFENRLQSSLLEKFGGQGWVSEWSPGAPFKNSFLLRSPAFKRPGVFLYDGDVEIGPDPAGANWIADLREAFIGVEDVKRHFADPAAAFDAVMTINDGGARYIATRLGPLCKPDAKLKQIAAQIETIRQRLLAAVEPLYVDADLDKMRRERLDVAKKILASLHGCYQTRRLGSMLRSYMVTSGELAAGLSRSVIEAADTAADSTGAAMPLASPGTVGMLMPWDSPAATSPAPQPARRPPDKVAEAAFAIWRKRVESVEENPQVARQFGIPSQILFELGRELIAIGARTDLAGKIGRQLEALINPNADKSDLRLAKATVVSERIINGFVSDLGFADRPEEERPQVRDAGGGERPVFRQRPVAYDASGIGPEPLEYGERFFQDWAFGFYRAVEETVASSKGVQNIDIEQNEIIGRAVRCLRGARPS